MSLKCIMCYFKFMHLHRCISLKYARCATRGIEERSWSRYISCCIGGQIQKTEELAGVHSMSEDVVKPVDGGKSNEYPSIS